MNVIFLGILIVICLVVFLTLLSHYLIDGTPGNAWAVKVSIISFLVGSLLGIWMVDACVQPLEISREIELTPAKVINPDGTFVQMINYTDNNGHQQIRDCSEIFKAIIPEGKNVLIREYKTGYYEGVSFEGTTSIMPTFHLKEAAKR